MAAPAVASTEFTFHRLKLPFGKLKTSRDESALRLAIHPLIHRKTANQLKSSLQERSPSFWNCSGLPKQTLFTIGMTSRTPHLRATVISASISDDKITRGDVTEPSTKFVFPSTLAPPGGSQLLSLIGAGVREKSIAFVTVKVYAVGFYGTASMLKTRQAMPKGNAPEMLQKIIADTEEKAIRIVMAMDVPTTRFLQSLSSEVAPRLKAAGAGPAGEASLAAFEEAFKGATFKKGSTIILSYGPPTAVNVTITPSPSSPLPSTAKAVVQSKDLWNALVDVYLGSNTVSPSLRTAVCGVSA